ncbi:MAG: Cof-type HAD-IIB family hydrolase [Chloroflexia bacterium]
MSVKLIALDLDGTIFTDDLVISPRMRAAIREARVRGVVVTLATGRMYRSAQAIARDLDIAQPLICYQGALVAHAESGEVLYHRTVPTNLAHEIIEETSRRGLHLNLYLNDKIYVSRITPEARFYSQINMDMPINEVGPLGPWLDTQRGAEPTKLVIITDPAETDRTLAIFTELFGDRLQVTKSHARFTEFTNAECSKGRALAFLAQHLGVAREEVMAIGDGHNDLDMIAWAGHGVAMPTSPQAVLDAARTVARTLAEDGAAIIIEEHVLA